MLMPFFYMYNTDMKSIRKSCGVILVLILSFFSIIPFFSPGFFPMHDNTQITRVFEMGRSLSDGMFPVRWVSDLGYGYGYPIFNFYSPFPYYLGGIINFLGLDSLLATKIIFVIGILVSGLTAYLFVKSFLGKTAALVSAISYIYFPYHAVNIYVRGDLGELFGYAFLPMVFWGLYKIHYSYKKDFLENNLILIVTSVSLALTILSHNLSAYMLVIFLAIFILLSLLNNQGRKKLILSYTFVLAFGFILSAFYSIPALTEMKYTNVFSQIGGSADYRDHFICLPQLWDSPWGFGGSIRGCVDGMSFKLGKIYIVISLFSILAYLYLIVRKKLKNNFFINTSIVFLFISIFLTLDWSGLIWNTVPFIGFLQYPWRFLNFAGLFLSVLSGVLVFEVKTLFNSKTAKAFSILLLAIIIFLNVKLFKPQFSYNRGSAYYTNEIFMNWDISRVSDEYMPADFQKPKSIYEIPKKKIELIDSEGKIQNLNYKTGLIKADLNLDRSTIAKINVVYFPGWEVFINNTQVPYKADKNGLYLSVPKGSSRIEAKLFQTNIERLSNILSIVGVFLLFCAIMIYIYNINYDKETP